MRLKRILFVDDEPHVLGGLRNLLRKHRGEWDMAFVESGDAALEELAKAPCDVVVSDMRMPGMDGAELLRRVQQEYPSVARIVLSGHAEQMAMVRALPVAHQFLSKPCDAETLRQVIERTCALQSLLHDEAIRTMVGRLDKLPSVPGCYRELAEAMTRRDGGLADVIRIVEADPAMSAKVLQLVNSGFFGFSTLVTSVRQAVQYLGLDLIQGLALTSHVFEAITGPAKDGFSLDRLQEHSVVTARVAKRLMGADPRAEEAFAAAIVHDIGEIVLALGAPDQWSEVVAAARATHRPSFVVERERFGVTHAEVGAYLLGVWGVPLSIVEVVAFHHTPSLRPAGPDAVLAAVHAADAWVHASSAAHGLAEEVWLDPQFCAGADVAGMLERWRGIASWQLGTTLPAAS